MTGHIAHHAAKSLMFRCPLRLCTKARATAWTPVRRTKTGFRDVEAMFEGSLEIAELPVSKA